MPYILPENRELLNGPQCAGDLNFVFSMVIIAYLEDQKLSYQTINDVVGALEGAKAEFYRRIVIPYEDKKILENGDIGYADLLSKSVHPQK